MNRVESADMSLDEVTLDGRNANQGTKRGRELLAESLKTLGAGRSILLDRCNRVVAGNKTVEQAKALGLRVRIVDSDGRALVAVRRSDLDLERDPAARELAIADNRVAEIDLKWDPDVLDQLRTDGLNAAAWWTDQEWADLTGTSGSTTPGEDDVVVPPATDITRGDLFELGRHRLLCGDATEHADVQRLLGERVPALMCTDPPYGVNYDAEWRHRAYPRQRTAVGKVMNDDQASWPDAFRHFPGDVVYAWHAGVRSADASAALVSANFVIRAQIVWVKSHFVLSRAAYHHGHEPCFYAVRKGRTASWLGGRAQSTVWTVPNLNPVGGDATAENTPTGHSTQKPVRLFEIPILNHTRRPDAIYDPFVGSGTAVIAAEKLGRTAFAMDLDPRYVQTTLDRWEKFTGRQATRVTSGQEGRDAASS